MKNTLRFLLPLLLLSSALHADTLPSVYNEKTFPEMWDRAFVDIRHKLMNKYWARHNIPRELGKLYENVPSSHACGSWRKVIVEPITSFESEVTYSSIPKSIENKKYKIKNCTSLPRSISETLQVVYVLSSKTDVTQSELSKTTLNASIVIPLSEKSTSTIGGSLEKTKNIIFKDMTTVSETKTEKRQVTTTASPFSILIANLSVQVVETRTEFKGNALLDSEIWCVRRNIIDKIFPKGRLKDYWTVEERTFPFKGYSIFSEGKETNLSYSEIKFKGDNAATKCEEYALPE